MFWIMLSVIGSSYFDNFDFFKSVYSLGVILKFKIAMVSSNSRISCPAFRGQLLHVNLYFPLFSNLLLFFDIVIYDVV